MLITTISIVVAVLFTAWAALVVQAMATRGDRQPYFAGILETHCPPDNDDDVVVDAPFPFIDSHGYAWVAPKGMESDGASVGALLRIPVVGVLVVWLIKGTSLTGPLRPASVSHDLIYGSATESSFWKALISPRRAIADRVIYEGATCGEYLLPTKTENAGVMRDALLTVKRQPLAPWRAFVVMALLRATGAKAWMDDSSRAQRSLLALQLEQPR
jgi:hypothetical protein